MESPVHKVRRPLWSFLAHSAILNIAHQRTYYTCIPYTLQNGTDIETTAYRAAFIPETDLRNKYSID